MTQVKICGLTRAADVELACALGAAYVGFNFAAASPRRVTLEACRDLALAARPGVARVGVFVYESREQIREAIDRAHLDLVQLHRPLAQEDLERLPRPVITVARVSRRAEPVPEELLTRCRSILFDTASADRRGGTGTAFDWGVLAGRSWPIPWILAGGLDPDNVRAAITRLRPSAVDVASGVESSPGIKNEQLMKCFFEEVRMADTLPRLSAREGRGEGSP